MSTVKDVAKLAGVSVATVSRVLNNEKSVSQKTRQIVLDAMETLSYKPNLLGRNLRTSKTKKILVLLPTISNQVYSRIVTGMEDQAAEYGYSVMVSMTHSNKETELSYIEMLKMHLFDGVVFLASQLSKSELEDISKCVPAVLCSEYVHGADVSTVTINNKRAAYDACKYLIAKGHQKIAIITSNEEYSSATDRENGYFQALEKSNIPIKQEYIRRNSYSYKGGIRACNELLSLKEPPTAIFAIADSMAIGVLRELHTSGNHQQKIAVFGFDNTSIASMFIPSISTVSQPRYDMGKMAMQLLHEKIKDNKIPNQFIVLEHELVIRESTF